MRWPGRSRSMVPLPPEVLDALGVGRGRAVLAGAQVCPQGWLVADGQALTLVDPADEAGGRQVSHWVKSFRVPWHQVIEALWQPEQRELHLRCEPGGPEGRVVQLVEQDTLLPEVVRERVMSTYVLSDRVVVRGRRGVTVAVRRDAEDGRLFVQTVPDVGLGQLDAEMAVRVQDLGEALGAQAGMPAPR